MATKRFTKEFLVDELGLPWEGPVLSDTITDNGRWSIHHELVFKNPEDGKCYLCSYSVGATESQDERPWEYDKHVDCTEVEERMVLTPMYVPVERSRKDVVESLLRRLVYVSEFLYDNEHDDVLESIFGYSSVGNVLDNFDMEDITVKVSEFLKEHENEQATDRSNMVSYENSSMGLVEKEDANETLSSAEERTPVRKPVPMAFTEQLIKRTNRYFREKGMPLQALFTGVEGGKYYMGIAKEEGGKVLDFPPVEVDLGEMFKFYRARKYGEGDPKSMLHTVEYMVSYMKLSQHLKGEDVLPFEENARE